ncbi:MAG: hypothetical protein AAF600_20040 [Bacteroidota bacterium]
MCLANSRLAKHTPKKKPEAPSGSGGSGPNHAGFGNSWVPTGGGSFDYVPDLPSGGSGGGVVFIIKMIYKQRSLRRIF